MKRHVAKKNVMKRVVATSLATAMVASPLSQSIPVIGSTISAYAETALTESETVAGMLPVISGVITDNLELASTVTYNEKEFTVSWESSNPAALSNEGVIGTLEFINDVVLTATVSDSEGVTATRSFAFRVGTVELLTQSMLEHSMPSIPGTTRTSFDVPTNISSADGTETYTLAWTSNDTSILTEAGAVTRPALGEADVVVKLTGVTTIGGVEYTIVKDVNVEAVTQQEVEADAIKELDKALATLPEFPQRRYEHLSMPETATGDKGTYDITWSSSNINKVGVDGVLKLSIYDEEEADTVLTATVSDSEGNTSSRHFNVTVVNKKMFAKEIFELNLPEVILKQNDGSFKIHTGLWGDNFHTDMTWESSNPDVLPVTGEAVRPAFGEEDVTVTLTGTFLVAGEEFSVPTDVVVKAITQEEIDEAKIKDMSDALYALPSFYGDVTEDMTLPSTVTGENGTYDVVWVSRDHSKLSDDGKVMVTDEGLQGGEVILTATASVDGLTASRNFSVSVVNKAYAANRDADILADTVKDLFYYGNEAKVGGVIKLPEDLSDETYTVTSKFLTTDDAGVAISSDGQTATVDYDGHYNLTKDFKIEVTVNGVVKERVVTVNTYNPSRAKELVEKIKEQDRIMKDIGFGDTVAENEDGITVIYSVNDTEKVNGVNTGVSFEDYEFYMETHGETDPLFGIVHYFAAFSVPHNDFLTRIGYTGSPDFEYNPEVPAESDSVSEVRRVLQNNMLLSRNVVKGFSLLGSIGIDGEHFDISWSTDRGEFMSQDGNFVVIAEDGVSVATPVKLIASFEKDGVSYTEEFTMTIHPKGTDIVSMYSDKEMTVHISDVAAKLLNRFPEEGTAVLPKPTDFREEGVTIEYVLPEGAEGVTLNEDGVLTVDKESYKNDVDMMVRIAVGTERHVVTIPVRTDGSIVAPEEPEEENVEHRKTIDSAVKKLEELYAEGLVADKDTETLELVTEIDVDGIKVPVVWEEITGIFHESEVNGVFNLIAINRTEDSTRVLTGVVSYEGLYEEVEVDLLLEKHYLEDAIDTLSDKISESLKDVRGNTVLPTGSDIGYADAVISYSVEDNSAYKISEDGSTLEILTRPELGEGDMDAVVTARIAFPDRGSGSGDPINVDFKIEAKDLVDEIAEEGVGTVTKEVILTAINSLIEKLNGILATENPGENPPTIKTVIENAKAIGSKTFTFLNTTKDEADTMGLNKVGNIKRVDVNLIKEIKAEGGVFELVEFMHEVGNSSKIVKFNTEDKKITFGESEGKDMYVVEDDAEGEI